MPTLRPSVRAFVLLAALAAAAAVPAAAQRPAGFDAAWREVVSAHRRANEASGIVGASFLLVDDGRVIAADHQGMADLEEGQPVDDGTLYHWASITKTFTAVAVMQLRDRGLLSLDDPVVRYVPELAGVHNPWGPMEEVTIRQLLSHSAGFRSPTWPWDGGEPWHPWEPTEWSQLVAMMPYTQIEFEPGSRFQYSNPGIVFLGRVIEALSGDVFEAYVEKNVFRPLGMERSYFDVTPWALRRHRSNNYRFEDGRPVANGRELNTGITVSNGGLNAPVGDLARWMAFLMGSPPGDGCRWPGGKAAPCEEVYDAVLARASLAEMWRPVVPIDEAGPLGPSSMGLSFFLYELDGRRLVGHTGSQAAFRSFFLMDPAARVAAVAVWNTAGGDDTAPDTDGLRVRLSQRVARELFPLFAGRRADAGR